MPSPGGGKGLEGFIWYHTTCTYRPTLATRRSDWRKEDGREGPVLALSIWHSGVISVGWRWQSWCWLRSLGRMRGHRQKWFNGWDVRYPKVEPQEWKESNKGDWGMCSKVGGKPRHGWYRVHTKKVFQGGWLFQMERKSGLGGNSGPGNQPLVNVSLRTEEVRPHFVSLVLLWGSYKVPSK